MTSTYLDCQTRGPMWRLYLFGLLISFGLSVPSAAQSANQRGREAMQLERPASEARSFVELFTKLERDWIQAVQEKDQTALDAILAPEFMLRSSEEPENPQLRADWIDRALHRYQIRTFSHRALAMRAFLGVAIVSFVQSQQATIDGKDYSGDYFIVDLWEVNHGQWQVSARYVAPVSNHSIGATNGQK
jgi:hypothetical protein